MGNDLGVVFMSWPIVYMKLLSVALVSALDLARTSRLFSRELSFFLLLLKPGGLFIIGLGLEFCWLKLEPSIFGFCDHEKFR